MLARFPRLRAAIGMGLTWGTAWFLAGMGLLLIVGPNAADVPFPVGFGFIGFLSGAVFSGLLRLTEGRRTFEQMSIPRFAGWGAVGGLVLAVAFVLIARLAGDQLALSVLAPVFAVAGSVSAAGSLAVARAGEDPKLLEGERD